jgi:hypothetical protein
MKIHIDIRDDIKPEIALERVKQVIKGGRVSKNNTMYCFMSIFGDNITVVTREYRKSDCFVVYKYKK